LSPAEQARRGASSIAQAMVNDVRAAPQRLLLVEPANSPQAVRIARAAAQANLTVEPLELPLTEVPPGAIIGIGPSVADPLQAAREVRHFVRHSLLVFFVASTASRHALHAALIRDPFVVERYELVEVSDDRRTLATRIAQVGARVEVPRHRPMRRARRERPARGSVDDRHLAAIVAHAGDAVLSADQRGRILTWNAAAERLLGFAADAAIGQTLSFLDAVDDGALGRLVLSVLDSQQSQHASVTCRHADGRTIGIAVSVAPVQDDRGACMGLSIVARDNSAQLRAEAALRDANRQKDEFLAIMSHELRTPLTSILGYTDMLLRGLGGPLAPRSSKYVSNVRAAGDRLLELVNGLLDYTRLEAGAERLDLREVDLAEVVAHVSERSRDQAASKDIDLVVTVDRSLGSVRGDQEKLEHVLRAYLGNALKFTPSGGRVQVDCVRDPVDPALLRVSVADSGIGLRGDQLSQVWERFYQGDLSLTRPYGGMGLGLSIARHLVQLHGGHVGAESRGPDLGSTFWFSLPQSS
jgi:PAS domain S-box-containing protein